MKKLIVILALACILLPSSVPAGDTTTTNSKIDSRGNVVSQTIETYDEDNPFANTADPQPDERQTVVNQPNSRKGVSNNATATTTVWDPSTSSYVNNPSPKKSNLTFDSRGKIVNQTTETHDEDNPFANTANPLPDERQTIVNQPNSRRGTSVRMNTSTSAWDQSNSYVNDPSAGTGNATIDSRGNVVNQTTETDDEDNPFAEEEDDPWVDESRNTRNQNTRGKGSSGNLMDDLNTINNQNLQRR